ncbi:MAG: hypothetical protein ACYCP0_03795 [Acidiferrobacteraceae bacterium]
MKSWATALLLLVAGCSRPLPASLPMALPILHRPVVALHHRVPWQPRQTARTPQDTLTIPRAALTKLGGLPGVFVLNHHDHARFRLVREGRVGQLRVQILSGLSGRETLVLGDLRDVHDGSPIVPQVTR